MIFQGPFQPGRFYEYLHNSSYVLRIIEVGIFVLLLSPGAELANKSLYDHPFWVKSLLDPKLWQGWNFVWVINTGLGWD